jgi:hypothetical protein
MKEMRHRKIHDHFSPNFSLLHYQVSLLVTAGELWRMK